MVSLAETSGETIRLKSESTVAEFCFVQDVESGESLDGMVWVM